MARLRLVQVLEQVQREVVVVAVARRRLRPVRPSSHTRHRRAPLVPSTVPPVAEPLRRDRSSCRFQRSTRSRFWSVSCEPQRAQRAQRADTNVRLADLLSDLLCLIVCLIQLAEDNLINQKMMVRSHIHSLSTEHRALCVFGDRQLNPWCVLVVRLARLCFSLLHR